MTPFAHHAEKEKDGSLYEVKPITLLTTLLNELQQRHQLDTTKVDDIVLGCVTQLVIRAVILPKQQRLQRAGMMMLQVCKLTAFVLQV